MSIDSSLQYRKDAYSEGLRPGDRLLYLFCLVMGVGACMGAALISELQFKYILGVVVVIGLSFIALLLSNRERLFPFFLAIFALSIPFRVNLGFFYRPHMGGAAGIDLSLSVACIIMLYVLTFFNQSKESGGGVFTANRLLCWTQIAFIMAGIISLVNATDYLFSLYELIRLAYLFLFFFLIMNLKEEKHLRLLIFFFSIGVLSQGVLAVIQYKTGMSLGLGMFGEQALLQQDIGYTFSRATGTIGHPNILAYYFEILLPLMFALVLVEHRKGVKLWYIIVTLAGLVGILTTLSRAGWLTIALSFSIVFLVLTRKKLFESKTVIGIVVASSIALVFFAFSFPTIVKRYTHDDYGSARSRVPVNMAALSVIKQFPVAGVGINNLGVVFERFDQTGGAQIFKDKGFMNVVHNMYLHVWSETGTIGLIAFLSMFLSALIVAARHVHKVGEWQSGVLIGIFAGLFAHMIHGLFDPGYRITMNISSIIYTLFGVIAAITLINRHAGEETESIGVSDSQKPVLE